MKLGPVVRFTKKMTLYKCGPGSGPNYGETAVCPLGREGNKWPKLSFSLYKQPQNSYSPLIIWEKGTFSFGQHCPVVAGTWLEARSESFSPKVRFLLYDPGFCQWPICSPRR